MSKVTVVGAGAVGATCANVMACREVASEVVLIDIKEGLSEGKMLDMYQCSTLMDFDTKLVGVTNDYKQTANSDVVDRKSTRLNSSHTDSSRMPSSA